MDEEQFTATLQHQHPIALAVTAALVAIGGWIFSLEMVLPVAVLSGFIHHLQLQEPYAACCTPRVCAQR
jgi:hypothetical protein